MLIDLAARALPNVAREKHFRLEEELTRVPSPVEVQEVVEGKRAVRASGQMSVNKSPVFVNLANPSDHVSLRRGKGESDRCKCAGRQHVTAVQPGENRAARERHSLIYRVALPAVFLADDVTESPFVPFQDAEGFIVGAAVANDVLDVRVSLIGDGEDGLLDEPALIIAWRYDRNLRPRAQTRHRWGKLN